MRASTVAIQNLRRMDDSVTFTSKESVSIVFVKNKERMAGRMSTDSS